MIRLITTDGLQVKISKSGHVEILATAEKGSPEEPAQLARLEEISAEAMAMGLAHRSYTRNQAAGPDRIDFLAFG